MAPGRFQIFLLAAATAWVSAGQAWGTEATASAPASATERRALAAAAAGDPHAAIPLLEEAARGYEESGDDRGRFRVLLRRGELERDLGRSHDAIDHLGAAVALAESSLGDARAAAAHGALASAWLGAGDARAAAAELTRAEEAADRSGEPGIVAAVALERGRLYESRGEREPARAAYAQAADAGREAEDRSVTFLALVNRAYLADGEHAVQELSAARAAGLELPPSRAYAYAWVRLARAGLRVGDEGASSPPPPQLIQDGVEADLDRALAMARATGDAGALSWAQGVRSELRSRQGRTAEALGLARGALRAAHQGRDPEAELRWITRKGELEAAAGDRDAAIADLSRAVELSAERRVARMTAAGGGASGAASSVGGDVYLELADLLLQRAPRQTDPQKAAADRSRAQHTMERLKAAELRDYFHDECVDAYRAKVKNPAAASPRAAVIYPISLKDRLELLVSSRRGIAQFTVDVPGDRLAATVDAFARSVRRRSTFEFMTPARQLDAWLVEPIQAHLEELGVDTLVFVPGPKLRTVPLAALHDGKSFLIERYALAVTPGLELTDPQPLRRQGTQVFLGGLSEAVGGFPALAYVPAELESVHEVFGGEILLDDDFTREHIERSLEAREFGIVHIATHGQFGRTSRETFLLTHDGRLTLDALADAVGAFRYRDTPLDLILLSACETAAGDERAALGLAGVAVKAGARSAIGSLWAVNDEATAILIRELYTQLARPGTSRAEALRHSQLKLLADLRYRHPGFWAPFLLISNWL